MQDFTATTPDCTDGVDAHCEDLNSLNDAIHQDLNYYHGLLDTHIADSVAHSDDSDSDHRYHHGYYSSHTHSHSSDSSSDSRDHWNFSYLAHHLKTSRRAQKSRNKIR